MAFLSVLFMNNNLITLLNVKEEKKKIQASINLFLFLLYLTVLYIVMEMSE